MSTQGGGSEGKGRGGLEKEDGAKEVLERKAREKSRIGVCVVYRERRKE